MAPERRYLPASTSTLSCELHQASWHVRVATKAKQLDRITQVFAVDRALRNARVPLSRERLCELLEGCSSSTLTRVLREMRDLLQAPIDYHREQGGYHYAQSKEGAKFELPGLWFSAAELYALLSCQCLLAGIQPGLLDEHLGPLRSRIEQIFRAQRLRPSEVGRRVRILAIAQRSPASAVFRPVASALLQRKQIRVQYHGRARNSVTERLLSPQRLVHYRDNWYLDGWDHDKEEIRTFSVDRILNATIVGQPAVDIGEDELDQTLGSSYGIFAGVATHFAVLKFTAARAKWVANEQWHPAQRSRWLPDGTYELQVPYSDSTELLMAILSYGPDVEVISPAGLRLQVAKRLVAAAGVYLQRNTGG